jgi:hypothetical protein
VEPEKSEFVDLFPNINFVNLLRLKCLIITASQEYTAINYGIFILHYSEYYHYLNIIFICNWKLYLFLCPHSYRIYCSGHEAGLPGCRSSTGL